MVDFDRLWAAYETARCDLLAECESSGHWIGELASSALATATAVSAIAVVQRHSSSCCLGPGGGDHSSLDLSHYIMKGLRWLAQHQNPDGGWGDTDKSLSNVATTMLVRAAFYLTAVPAQQAGMLERAEQYIAAHDGVAGLKRRYGKDKTFAAPILANCALAGVAEWRDVPALPFELACLPEETWNSLRMPVVSYAIPALVAIGQARYFHAKPWNPISRYARAAAIEKTLRVLQDKQPSSGGFLEATPLTSFVVMSLASMGRADHPIVRRGLAFLIASVRRDGSWPIDTNLATWNTTLCINALASAGEEVGELDCWQWLLQCQQTEKHPYTGTPPGGWAWTDLPGGVPDADDTAGALLSIGAWRTTANADEQPKILRAATSGVRWLLDLQNKDGGWPTFCRGWGKLRFDRSGADLTAHVLRALYAWREPLVSEAPQHRDLQKRFPTAISQGLDYLAQQQLEDGSWKPLWFGNQWHPQEYNPVYGTARVLLAYRDLGKLATEPASRGMDWLCAAQNCDGGWGGNPPSGRHNKITSTVEETALAVETLVSCALTPGQEAIAMKGVKWLVDAVAAGRHQESSPIGFYFAKLWYYERLYPLAFSVAALGRSARRFLPKTLPATRVPAGSQPDLTETISNAHQRNQ